MLPDVDLYKELFAILNENEMSVFEKMLSDVKIHDLIRII